MLTANKDTHGPHCHMGYPGLDLPTLACLLYINCSNSISSLTTFQPSRSGTDLLITSSLLAYCRGQDSLSMMKIPDKSPACSLLDLPNEILLNVLEHLTDQEPWNGQMLSSFRRTCSSAYKLADPVWCRSILTATHRVHNKLHLNLQADMSREHYVRNLIMARDYDILARKYDVQPTRQKETDTAQLAFRFRNLRYLEFRLDLEYPQIDESGPGLWMESWNDRVLTCHFANLTECYLRADPYHIQGIPVMQIAPLLQAPRLASLTLSAFDLRYISEDFASNHSTPLKHLKLNRCLIDDQTISTLMSKPRALRSLDIGDLIHGAKDSDQVRMDLVQADEELSVMQMMLQTIAEHQPDLAALKFSLRHRELLDPSGFVGDFDFAQLKKLKELYFKESIYGFQNRSTNIWCPFHLFTKLPASIENVGLKPRLSAVDVSKLADLLLDPLRNPNGFPKSLRRIRFITRCHDELRHRPFQFRLQREDDNLRRGIGSLLTASSLSQLDYSQRNWPGTHHGHHNFFHWIRELKATASIESGAAHLSSIESNTYDLEEVTWVQQLVVLRENRYPVQYEKKVWGPERWNLVLDTTDSSRRIVSTSLTTGLKPEQGPGKREGEGESDGSSAE